MSTLPTLSASQGPSQADPGIDAGSVAGVAPTSGGTTTLQLPERWLPAVRVGWLLLLLLVVWLAIVAQDQLQPSLDFLNTNPDSMVSGAVLREGIAELGLSPWLIAWVIVVENALQLTLHYALAALLIWRRPREVIALVISVFLLASTAPIYPLDLPDMRAEQPLEGWASTLTTYLFICSFYLLTLLFPTGRFVPRWLVLPAVAFIALEFGAFFIASGLQTLGTGMIDSLLLATVLLTGVGGQIYRYRRVSGPVEREQTRVFAFGIGLAMTLFVVLNIFLNVANLDRPDYPPVQGLLVTLGFDLLFGGLFMLASVSLVVAILRYRLFDLQVVINRSLVYLALTACVVGLYVLIVGGLGALLETGSGGFTALVATAVIAVAFQPLRAHLQRGVNRLLYGRRDEPYAVLTGLSRRLEGTDAPTAVLPAIVNSVAVALRLPYVAIALREVHEPEQTAAGAAAARGQWQAQEQEQIAAAVGAPPGAVERLPLLYQGVDVGTLLVAPRSGDGRLTVRDRAVLDDLLGQIGIAVHAVRLTADLQRSRERIVTAREEELRRLRRDLHDGLGPRLASLTLRIDTARDQLAHDPLAADLLDDLSARTEAAVADIRRLVYGLRPPALDDLGLLGAIRQTAESLHPAGNGLSIQIEAPDDLPPLPAATEVAAFRIIQEALTNIVRHAAATQCTISLTVDADAALLTLAVRDDGRGIDPQQRRGIGLHAMHERAAELGGSCTLVSPLADGHGTLLTATLPSRWLDAPLPTVANVYAVPAT